MDKVSVIMPAYNCEKYIAQSIAGVAAQTYTEWELIVCDDCSSDSTKSIVEEMAAQDSRIKCCTTVKNVGASEARNLGIEKATGRYIAFLDSDDIWLPEKLEKQVAFMKANGCVLSCTAYEQIDEDGNKTGRVVKPFRRADYNRCLYSGNCIGNSTAIYDAEALGKVYVPSIRKRNDFALWLRILKKCEFACGLQEVLACYRNRSNSLSKNKLGLIRYHWQLYRKIEKLNVVKSCAAIVSLLCFKAAKKIFRR